MAARLSNNRLSAMMVDPAFQNVGKNFTAFVIWRVEVRLLFNFEFVSLSLHVIFSSGYETGPATQGFLWQILQW